MKQTRLNVCHTTTMEMIEEGSGQSQNKRTILIPT